MLCKSFVLAVVYAWRVDSRPEVQRQSTQRYMPYDAFLLAMSGTLESNGAIQEHEGLTGGPRLICPSLFRPNALSTPPLSFPIIQPWLPCRPPTTADPPVVPRSHLISPASSLILTSSLSSSPPCIFNFIPRRLVVQGPFSPFLPNSRFPWTAHLFHRLFRSPTLLRTPTHDIRPHPWPHLSRFNEYLTTNPALHNQRVDIIGQVQCWDRHTCNYNLRSSQSLEIPPHSLTIYQLTHPFITICNRLFHFNQISLDAPRHNTQARTS